MTRVLDAHALLVFLEKEKGYEKVGRLFAAAAQDDDPLLMTTVNYGEVYTIVLRECGPQKTHEVEAVIRSLPVEVVDVDLLIAKEAARFKAGRNISYADCFAAALAKARKAGLITGDREFKALERDVSILWI